MRMQQIPGAVVGDIIGSVYKFPKNKSTDFELFGKWSYITDDSVMTLAIAKCLIEDKAHTIHHLVRCMQELGHRYPNAGDGCRFEELLTIDDQQPYNSWGNGAGMRVSLDGLYAKSLYEANI